MSLQCGLLIVTVECARCVAVCELLVSDRSHLQHLFVLPQASCAKLKPTKSTHPVSTCEEVRREVRGVCWKPSVQLFSSDRKWMEIK